MGKLSLTPGWALPSAAYSSKWPSLMFYKSVQRTHWFPRLNFGGLFYTGLLLGPSKKGVDIGFMAPGKEFSKYDSRFCQVENINHHRSYNLSRWISCRYELEVWIGKVKRKPGHEVDGVTDKIYMEFTGRYRSEGKHCVYAKAARWDKQNRR